MTLPLLLLAAWLGALLSWSVARLPSPLARHLPALLPAAGFVLLAAHLPEVMQGQVIQQEVNWVPSLGVNLALRLDGFALLFGLLITGIGALVTIYASAYFRHAPASERARFLFLIQAFMAAMLGTVLADNLVVMFVFWEATSLLSFLLIGFDTHKPEARKAALQSLLVTAGGGLALFAAILLIGLELQTFSLAATAARSAELLASPWLVAIVVLLMVGAFTKSAQFPFHFWLPRAMAAPTPASAYLHSATMVKLGIYLLARFSAVFDDLPWFGPTLVVTGLVTMVIAALGAVRATGYKALLAQSTVASLGILVMLIGLGGPLAAVAVCGFILAHALYKAALFFCAGTAIHATSTGELRELGGLARVLPLTAAGAVLAGLSMAGLPPFLGFLAKESLFESQWHHDWHLLPIAVSVMVNGLMAAVAAAAVLRPFFLHRERLGRTEHGESPGLVAGPLVLGLLGLAAGLAPGVAGDYLILPAAAAIAGVPVAGPLALWHGVTPMLALSLLVIVLGALLAWQWPALQRALAPSGSSRLDANAMYQRVVDGMLLAAAWSTRQLQNGDLRRYTGLTAIVLVALPGWAFLRAGGPGVLTARDEILVLPALLLGFGVIGALAAVWTRSLMAGLIGVGVIGYGSALLFLLHGAPDLALTQFAVETLVLVVLVAVLLRLPATAVATRSPWERRRDAVIATAFGLLMFGVLASLLELPFDTRLSDFFGASSLLDAHGQNVVNVIIVDYRALDTLGEIAVVGFATLGVWALLRRRAARRASRPHPAPCREENACHR